MFKEPRTAATKSLVARALQPIPFAILFRDGNWRRILWNKATQRPSAVLTQPTSGLPQFQVSSSKVFARNIVAHPCGVLASCAKRSAERRKKNIPPIPPRASRASQNPFLLRPIKNSGITRLRTRASGRLGRMVSARCVAAKSVGGGESHAVTSVKRPTLRPRNWTARGHLYPEAAGSARCRAATVVMHRRALPA